jgi:hypothetical protein
MPFRFLKKLNRDANDGQPQPGSFATMARKSNNHGHIRIRNIGYSLDILEPGSLADVTSVNEHRTENPELSIFRRYPKYIAVFCVPAPLLLLAFALCCV